MPIKVIPPAIPAASTWIFSRERRESKGKGDLEDLLAIKRVKEGGGEARIEKVIGRKE